VKSEVFVDVDYRDTIPGLRAAADRLDWPLVGNARTGGRYSMSYGRYDDGDREEHTFNRFELDAQQYIPFLKGHRIVALRAQLTLSDPEPGHEVPFYYLPTLGGAYTLRGFRSFRFRDRNAMLFQAEYRYHVNPFVMGALFYDAGKVSRERDELDFEDLESDWGLGLRLGNAAAVVMRLDIAFGSGEGTRYLLRFNNVF
jgi:outer membrane protein assembly factor BamA